MGVRSLHALRAAALSLVVVGVSAWAQTASISGPSVARAGSTVTLSAKSLPANAAVSLAVTQPSGREAHYSAVAGADGTLSVTIKSGEAGAYRVRVLDSGGRELSATTFNAQ
jgi:hypothetical protein